MKVSVVSLMVFAAVAAQVGYGEFVLVDWNLNTVSGPTVNNAPFEGVEASVATVADGITVTDLITVGGPGHSGLVWSSGNPGPGQLNLQRWDHPNDNPSQFGHGSGNPNNWLQFEISADSDFTLSAMTVSAWRNGGGAPARWSYEYSLDGGENWTAFGSVHFEQNAGDGIYRNVTFTDSVTVSRLWVRFIGIGPDGGTGNLHINEMTFVGVPEPATLGLLATGVWGVAAWRKRK
ncbi:MAG: PEP-CTERM sorting domain-containing protein [Planctomycetes bacterium]|jgi:hypothetical protein|nr:PEP-CTERM sorting domain-containing protein [Planctomycetota bacterium]